MPVPLDLPDELRVCLELHLEFLLGRQADALVPQVIGDQVGEVAPQKGQMFRFQINPLMRFQVLLEEGKVLPAVLMPFRCLEMEHICRWVKGLPVLVRDAGVRGDVPDREIGLVQAVDLFQQLFCYGEVHDLGCLGDSFDMQVPCCLVLPSYFITRGR